MAVYLDTSAASKLVVRETETPALRRWIRNRTDEVVSSDIMRTELTRATRRVAPGALAQARAVLESVTLIDVSSSILERAALLEPLAMRSLDAIHLATAVDLGDDIDVIVTYDHRLSEAARTLGFVVAAPH
jgi:predicted nucleic acid-binding protein